MASISLYPPIVDSSMPAFNYLKSCPIKFSLSKFNSPNEIKSIQISVAYQKSGINAVKKIDNDNRYRRTGIIIINTNELRTFQLEDNLYSVFINPDDLNGGWEAGEIYKVQIRFSTVPYIDDGMPERWLYNNANNFSEWSTVCSIKPIGAINISIPIFNYESATKNEDVNSIKENPIYSTILDFHGSYYCETPNETLYSYELFLYNENLELIEKSGILYSNEYANSNQFKYLFSTELLNQTSYELHFIYYSEHGYTETIKFNFFVSANIRPKLNFSIVTVDKNIEIEKDGKIKKIIDENESTLESEEEEGRIGIKIYDFENKIFSGNICIRRTDNKSNFTKWEDIQILVYKQESINDKEIIFDYTVESGIWYQYALQEITVTPTGEIQRSNLTPAEPIIRNFNYSYLLGANGIQLKLKYDNDMNSYKINVNEGKMDTIGGIYPFITRNGNPNYRTFPINGLISFNMDEMNTFSTKKEIYGDKTIDNKIVNYYNKYNNQNNIIQYDYIYERFFREKVLKFLYDGKPKLFKSTTEGNIIVRLMDINTTPKQNLGRMIYSFSSTGHEIAEANIENYIKYHFMEIKNPEQNFAVYQTNIGQISGEFSINENICQRIWEKYDSQGKNYAGYSYTLGKIKYLRIEINSNPFRITNNSQSENNENIEQDYSVGNKINYNGNIIVIYGNKQIYEFDSLITFTKNDIISFLGPDDPSMVNSDGTPITINATIDFVYEISKDIYIEKQVLRYEYFNGIGQYYENTFVNTSIYNLLFYKYYTEWDNKFSKLEQLIGIEIEASPGAVFYIKNVGDLEGEYHDINYTGVLRIQKLSDIKELKFLGFRQPDGSILNKTYLKTITHEDGIIENIYQPISTDVLVNYNYILTKGEYVKNAN